MRASAACFAIVQSDQSMENIGVQQTSFAVRVVQFKANLGVADRWFSADCLDYCFSLKVGTSRRNLACGDAKRCSSFVELVGQKLVNRVEIYKSERVRYLSSRPVSLTRNIR